MMFNKILLNEELLKDKSVIEQYGVLRQYLMQKYHIDYIATFVKGKSGCTLIEGDTKISEQLVNNLNIDMPQVKFNKNVLIDSKDIGVCARFSIPIKFEKDYLLILESKKYKTIIDKEKEIYKDIYDFKSIVNKMNFLK